MLNVAILHKGEKTERRVKRRKAKSPEHRMLEKELYQDGRYHAKRVTNNKGRSREKQELRRLTDVAQPRLLDDPFPEDI